MIVSFTQRGDPLGYTTHPSSRLHGAAGSHCYIARLILLITRCGGPLGYMARRSPLGYTARRSSRLHGAAVRSVTRRGMVLEVTRRGIVILRNFDQENVGQHIKKQLSQWRYPTASIKIYINHIVYIFS